jgi:hypothetical protein
MSSSHPTFAENRNTRVAPPIPRARNEYIVFTGAPPPVCPLFAGRSRCAHGPAIALAVWWTAHRQEVLQYVQENLFYLGMFYADLIRVRSADAANGKFERNLFITVHQLRQFETRHRAIVNVLTNSLDDVTGQEQETLANAMQTRRVALRSFRLISNMFDEIQHTVEERYIRMVAGPADKTPQQLVELLILQVIEFLNETQ